MASVTNRLDPGLWRLNPEEARGLAALDTAPELSFGRDDKVLVERIGMGRDLNPFAAASRNHDFDERYARATEKLFAKFGFDLDQEDTSDAHLEESRKVLIQMQAELPEGRRQ